MKTTEEIKRGLEMCAETCFVCPAECPYMMTACSQGDKVMDDARAYIQQLEQDNAQKDERIRKLERELAAAMNAILYRKSCIDCKHSTIIYDGSWVWTDCPKRDGRCSDNKDLWEWRGVKEEANEAERSN